MRVRRVVTGHDEDGNAVFASDEAIEPVTAMALPGFEFHQLWGGDSAPTFPDRGAPLAWRTYFPPIGGFRFGFFTLPPARQGSESADAAPADAVVNDLDARLPGLAQYLETEAPGMHTTPTIDFEVIVSGEVVLELDAGASVTLRPGDTVVQNGTRHRWRNASATPATIAYFICGAHHARFATARRQE